MTRRSPFLRAALALALGLPLAGCDEIFPHRSEGEKLYRKLCMECHGVDGAGNTPRYMGNPWADLRDNEWKSGGDPVSMEYTVRNGIFGQMPANPELSRQEIRAIVDYVRVLRGEKRPEPSR